MTWPSGQPGVVQSPFSSMTWPSGQPGVDVQPVCAGLLRPTPWLRSHSSPALWSLPFGYWPLGFLLSALPTQPAHGLPVALPPPLPLPDGLPSRVEQYGPSGHCPLAPPEVWSALDTGCGWLGSPEVPALPLL